MSQTLAGAAARAAHSAPTGNSPARSPRPSVRRPPLRVVQAPPTTGSPLGFAVLCVGLLGAGLIVLLLLNTAVAQDSFGLQRLQAGAQTLADQRQALIQNNDLAAAPDQLSAKAWSLGLVPASGTAFVELPSGKVMGVANPAPRVTPPTVITSTTSTNGTTSTTKQPTAPSSGSAPGKAPAITVDRTARAGAAPPVAPAAPEATKSQKSQKSKKSAKSHQPATTTR
jgi:hypothetical protein